MSARRGPWIVAIVAAAVVWVSGLAGAYGWFIDELYFRACARHLALGYVDQPPLAPGLLALVRAIAGDALWLMRLVPAAAFAATVVVTARIAAQLGGDRAAQLAAALLAATCPAFLVIASFYSMNPIELLVVALLTSTLVALANGGAPRGWLVAGALVGVAVINKHTVVVAGGLLFAATLLTPARAHLRTRWPWLGLALALAIAAPHLAWLVAHDGVTFEFYRVSTAAKNVDTSPAGALLGQLLFAGPLGFAAAAVGGGWLLRGGAGRAARGFGGALAAGLLLMALARVSRPDRIAGLYPLGFAAGAVALARSTAAPRRRRLRAGGGVALALGTLVTVPIVLPVLPPDRLARYAAALELTPQLERQKPGALPQWLADRLGWRDVVDQTAAVVATLAPDERAAAVLFGEHYGIAGALELYGPARGLRQPVVSPHNAYWTWGPVAAPVLVGVGGDLAVLRAAYSELREVARIRCERCYLDGAPIWIARGPAGALALAWPRLRHFR